MAFPPIPQHRPQDGGNLETLRASRLLAWRPPAPEPALLGVECLPAERMQVNRCGGCGFRGMADT